MESTAPSTGPVRLKQFVERHKAEGWTEPSVRWLVFKASDNGLERCGAVFRLGSRVFIDEPKFYSWLREQGRAA